MAGLRFTLAAFDKTAAAFASVDKRINALQKSFSGLKSSFGGIAGTIIGAFAGAGLKAIVDFTSKIDDMSQRLGISSTALSGLGYAAKLGGVELDGLGTSLKTMQDRISNASMGARGISASFAELGLSVQQLKSLSPDEAFKVIAESLSKVENQTDKTRLAMDVFGKSGADLIPIMNGGAEAINAAQQELNELNAVVDSGMAQQLGGLGDAWDSMATAAQGAGMQLVTFFAPALEAVVSGITTLLKWIGYLGKGLRGMQTGLAIAMVRTSEFFGDTNAEAADAAVKKLAENWWDVANGTDASNKFVKDFTENSKRGAAAADKISKSMKPIAISRTKDKTTTPPTASVKSPIENDLVQIKDTGVETAQILKDSFKDALGGVGQDFNSMADIATNAIDRIRQNMTDKAANILTDSLFSSGEGLLNGALQDIFRPSSGSVGPVNVPSISDFFGGFFANGGNFQGGKPIIVGERGPEMILPRGSGTVIPNEAMSGGRGISVTMNIHTPDAGSFRQSQSQIAAEASMAMQRASRNL
jgi:hypothetical protein